MGIRHAQRRGHAGHVRWLCRPWPNLREPTSPCQPVNDTLACLGQGGRGGGTPVNHQLRAARPRRPRHGGRQHDAVRPGRRGVRAAEAPRAHRGRRLVLPVAALHRQPGPRLVPPPPQLTVHWTVR